MNPFRNVFSSVLGGLVGAAFVAGSFPLLFWNENRAVETERSLGEGRRTLVIANSASKDPANNGKLIYVSGDAGSAKELVDPVTKIAAKALLLERNSEMFQWIEKSEKSGSGNERTYRYDKEWRSGIDSHHQGGSGHRNPASYTLRSGTEIAGDAKLGAYEIPPAVLKDIGATTPFVPESGDLRGIGALFSRPVQTSGQFLYLGNDPASPEIGDERVRLRVLPPGPISVIARQEGNSLVAHTTSNGREILLAKSGVVGADTMFERAFSTNRTVTWLLRAGGALIMFLGLRLVIEPLTNITDWIPFVGSLVDLGATLASAIVAVSLSLIAIGVAWLAVRPLLASGLLVAACGLVFLVMRRGAPARRPLGSSPLLQG